MNIKVGGSISVVSTKQKSYTKVRKGFWRNGKYIKPKKFTKFRRVPIKEPFLAGTIYLTVDEHLEMGETYFDGKINYVCTSVMAIVGYESLLQNHSLNLGKTFNFPKNLTKINKINQL